MQYSHFDLTHNNTSPFAKWYSFSTQKFNMTCCWLVIYVWHHLNIRGPTYCLLGLVVPQVVFQSFVKGRTAQIHSVLVVILVEQCCFGYWEWFSHKPFIEFPKITEDKQCVVFFGLWKLAKPIQNLLAIWVPPSHIVFGFPIWWFPSDFRVLGKVDHGEELVLPSVQEKLLHNSSHLVSHQTAPQILAGDPIMMIFLGPSGVCYNHLQQLPWDLFSM